ncbi:MAG: PilZ domain-containing protein [Hyphomicrobiales bacterium]|nr:MAG: PilZ domain-containing protein [Hyphomicrobiales bacterium]
MGQNASQRSSDIRFIGALMGRYLLASRKNRSHRVQVLACRLQSISPQLMVASAPVLGAPGEELSANFEPFGTVRGRVERLIDGGFSMAIETSIEERDLLIKRIGWYKKRVFHGVADKRAHRRVMPRDPRSTILFADGSRLPCLIIDMSRSGAALSADVQPDLGTPLAVGRVVARVVRWLDVGFAVQFLIEQEPESLEDRLHLVDA